MNALVLRSLALWLTLLESLAALRGWRGLSWLGLARPDAPAPSRALRAAPLLLAAAPLHPRGAPWARRAAALTAAAPAALLLQLALASTRNRRLDPLAQLTPGVYADRTVERVDIGMSVGHCPGLHVVPRSGATAAVCVLHGSGCDKTYFAWRLTDALLRQGLAVLLVDLDGHGENPRPQRYPGATEVAEVAAGWLRERYRRVGLLGISLGGCIAARAAADGAAVDAVALLETPPALRFTNADRWREARWLLQPFMFDLLRETTAYRLAYAVYDLVRAQRAPRIAAEISTWDLIDALDLCGSVPKISAPLLLVYGGRDAIVKPEQAEQVRRLAPGARFVLVPEASHLTLILHPQAMSMVGAWFAEALQGAGGGE